MSAGSCSCFSHPGCRGFNAVAAAAGDLERVKSLGQRIVGIFLLVTVLSAS
jgi:hypothetical protein